MYLSVADNYCLCLCVLGSLLTLVCFGSCFLFVCCVFIPQIAESYRGSNFLKKQGK